MAKKKSEVDKEVEAIVEKAVAEVLRPISPITTEFGREDLNQLRDKINEIVQRV